MRFHPTSEQVAIQDAIGGTLADALPIARLHALADGDDDFDRASWDALMALGLAGMMLPEGDGGAGLGLVDLAMATETLGACAAAGPVVQHLLAVLGIDMAGGPARDRWLPALADGGKVATLALGGDWLPQGWDVACTDDRLTGTVRFVPGARSADIFLVGLAGGGLALVEAGEGVRAAAMPSSDRTRRLSDVTFEHAPATILFAPGDPAVERWFDAALVLCAADALGGAGHCLDLAVGHAKSREQFGVPIGQFQALKHQLATMALAVEPARALLWYAAYAWDRRVPDAPRAAAIAKAHIADRFVTVARDAVAAHGGIGYTWEYELNLWFRRSLFDRAYLGSPGLHRARAADLAGW